MRWSELSWPKIQECAKKQYVVVLPCGVIEQHGYHLPVDTDAHIAQELARSAAQQLSGVLVGPTIAFGFSPSNAGFPGTISLRSETWKHLLTDVCRSIARHGFKKILLLNGHGGQEALASAIGASIEDELGFSVVVLSWYRLVGEEISRICPGDGSAMGGVGHAGDLETSLTLYLRPDLAGQGEAVRNAYAPQLEFIQRARASIQIPRERLSVSGVIGDATVATAEKGEKIFRETVDRLRGFLEQYRQLEDF